MGHSNNYNVRTLALYVACKLQEKPEAELHWRLARVTYELSKGAESSQRKAELVEEAFGSVQRALEIDDSNFAAHKWMAIILNQISTLKGTKEQITQSYNVRHHMDVCDLVNSLYGSVTLEFDIL